jgi:antitoxin VapB
MDNTMTVAKTRTFRSGNSEAIRLPKDVAFGEGVELVVVRSGNVVTLYPAATSIPEMIARLEALPRPTSIEERDDEELPEPASF